MEKDNPKQRCNWFNAQFYDVLITENLFGYINTKRL
jgi:hypothetical protein